MPIQCVWSVWTIYLYIWALFLLAHWLLHVQQQHRPTNHKKKKREKYLILTYRTVSRYCFWLFNRVQYLIIWIKCDFMPNGLESKRATATAMNTQHTTRWYTISKYALKRDRIARSFTMRPFSVLDRLMREIFVRCYAWLRCAQNIHPGAWFIIDSARKIGCRHKISI